MTGRIVCVGDVMLDVLSVLPAELAVGSDTPAPVVVRHGGSAANTAAWLAALGVAATFVGRVGDDPFGRDVVESLTAQGVSVRVAIDPEASTGICIVLVGPDGERTMIPSAGANARLAVGDLPAVLVASGDHLHLSGYTLFNPGSRAAGLAALGEAVRAGAGISVDASSADPLRTVGPTQFLDWLPPESVLIANHDEAAVLSGVTEAADAAATLATRTAAVIVKCGRGGAIVAHGSAVDTVETDPVQVLDSTGAGDAFAAGVLAALVAGADLVTAARNGNLIGARAVSRLGARPAS
ncbi:MAG TPA: carbohydrate kinase family protein [Jatrophihabitans sp.]